MVLRVLLGVVMACSTASPEPVPEVPSEGTVDVRVLTPIPEGENLLLVLGSGTDAGLAVGDRGRLACIDVELIIVEVLAKRSKARIPEVALGTRPLPRVARMTLGGQATVPYCPAQ